MMRTCVVAFIVVAFAVCTSACASKRPTRQAIETRVAVDGSATMPGDVERVRTATVNALKAIGYEIDDKSEALATKPKIDRVSRWRWSEATNPAATQAATVGAALSQGVVPTSVDDTPAGTPSDTEISVSYTVDLVADDAGSATTVVVQPHAVLEGTDVTEHYLVAIGGETARRKFDELFDAIRAQLAALPASTSADAPLDATVAPNSTAQ